MEPYLHSGCIHLTNSAISSESERASFRRYRTIHTREYCVNIRVSPASATVLFSFNGKVSFLTIIALNSFFFQIIGSNAWPDAVKYTTFPSFFVLICHYGCF